MTKHPLEVPIVAIADSHVVNLKDLYGNELVALDGEIGHVEDFYFDDNIWVLRYAIADTASWLSDRLVMLSPHAFGQLDKFEKALHINLRKAQIQDSHDALAGGNVDGRTRLAFLDRSAQVRREEHDIVVIRNNFCDCHLGAHDLGWP